MSSKEKEGDRATVFRTTKVRTKLKGDASWLQRRDEPQAETEEEKPWLAEVRAGRLNGAPIETSPVTSPTKPPLPPNKPDADRAPTSGFLIRGVFTKLDNKSAPSSTSNGISGTTQFSKKPSESYKRIAPHTVRNTSENREGQLSQEEQDKRTEAASNVLKQSAVRQRSYVLSAAKKYESKEKAPDTISPSFVAKRVEIVDDDDESATAPAPASSPPPTPVIPVTSVASAPQPKPRKIVDTGAKTAVEEPVAPKVKETAPEPVKEDPAPVSVTKKDPFEDMKPGCTKVATPLPEYVPTCVQAVCAEPEPEDSDVSGQAVTPLVPLTPALPTLVSSTSASPAPPPTAPKSPVSPAPAPTALKSPASPAPAETAPKSPAPAPTAPKSPASPAPAETAPKSPAPASPAPAPTAPKSPASPAPAETAPKSPAPASPAPAPTAPKSPASPAPAPTDPESPAPVPPIPLSPVPVSTVTAITVKSEPEPEPEPEPEEDPEPEPESKLSPKPSASVDTLTALYGSLISFDTSSTSFQDDEPALAKEEGGSADSHTAENGVEEEPALNNCEPETEDLLALDDGPEESAEPVPPSPGRWSQDLLGGLDSEAEPAKTSGSLDLLANDVVLINTEPHSLSTQREEEKQTDETAKATQSPTETVTITTKTVIITDKSEEDNADPWSTHVTTTVTESSSADPFDPYPIGTTSPNSSSDLLQPLTDISINRASTTSMENQDPSPEINMSSGALKSLADDVIPINTDTTSLSTKRSWARTWETSTPQQTNTEKSQEPEPEGQAKDQETLIMFERKSNENDSPWDKWTSPTVYTITTTAGEVEEEEEEEEEEESPEDTQTQTVTTFTTIREIQSEPEPAMDRYETYSRTVIEEDRQVQTPEPETKKGIVYVKEYVNATELSLHNARDTCDDFYRGSDNLTSSSMSYSYSSPSTYSSGSLSSTCTYCGEQVGNDAKITIEHLNINCHPACFKCGVCSKPMGDLLYSMFLHGGKVHCESCYSKAFD